MSAMIPIPSSIEEVTPELCGRAWNEICGFKPGDSIPGYDKALCDARVIGKNFHVFLGKTTGPEFNFNPFTRPQDTKLLDKWLVGNGFIMNVDLLRNGNWECRVFFSHNSGIGYVSRTAPTEEMARACAVLMAYNKLKEDK